MGTKMTTTLFAARKILTMDPNRSEATHVAVRDGRILAVGGAECADPWGGAILDDSLKDAVLMPGFVEGHAHMMAGSMWRYAYAGYHDRVDPDGRLWPGLTDIDAVIAGLRAYEAGLPTGEPLIGWGFDPIFLTTERLNRHHLDKVSADRPIVIIHSNFHLLTTNSAGLAMAEYTASSEVEGVLKGGDGTPTGELQEMAAMFPVLRRSGVDFRALSRSGEALDAYGRTARRVGVTTATDLYSELQEGDIAELARLTGAADFPLRLVPALNALTGRPEEVRDRALALRALSTDMLRLGAVKLMTDGSIQGFTARIKWPGHLHGQPAGIWNMAPEQIFAYTKTLHAAGLQMHIHVNGDEASEVTLDALEVAMTEAQVPDSRHVLQHGQMIGLDQFRRMKALGLCANLFANHIYYFGDQHATLTIGQDRAERMDACRSALDTGVALAIHSDAPVTPMGPLFTAWCAVNRLTGSGRVLGAAQRIAVSEALYAITMGAAYTLKLDDEIGSIEAGKSADFAVLGEDPTAVAPEALKDVPVLGTVSGGRVFLT